MTDLDNNLVIGKIKSNRDHVEAVNQLVYSNKKIVLENVMFPTLRSSFFFLLNDMDVVQWERIFKQDDI